jgi:hypothetical protein
VSRFRRDPDFDPLAYETDDCPDCLGTGEGMTDRESCWTCRGCGLVAEPIEDEPTVTEPDDESEPTGP